MLGQNVRIGRPLRIQGLPHNATAPSFSSAIGLALRVSYELTRHEAVSAVTPDAGGRDER
jgi:cell division ATPase FtsA